MTAIQVARELEVRKNKIVKWTEILPTYQRSRHWKRYTAREIACLMYIKQLRSYGLGIKKNWESILLLNQCLIKQTPYYNPYMVLTQPHPILIRNCVGETLSIFMARCDKAMIVFPLDEEFDRVYKNDSIA